MDSIELLGRAAAENLGGGLQDIVPRQRLTAFYVSSLHVPLVWPSRFCVRTEFNSELKSGSPSADFKILTQDRGQQRIEEQIRVRVPSRPYHQDRVQQRFAEHIIARRLQDLLPQDRVQQRFRKNHCLGVLATQQRPILCFTSFWVESGMMGVRLSLEGDNAHAQAN